MSDSCFLVRYAVDGRHYSEKTIADSFVDGSIPWYCDLEVSCYDITFSEDSILRMVESTICDITLHDILNTQSNLTDKVFYAIISRFEILVKEKLVCYDWIGQEICDMIKDKTGSPVVFQDVQRLQNLIDEGKLNATSD